MLGLFALVMASTGFFQALLDLTIEEALIKYGFRYIAREDWGRFHRLFRRTFVFKVGGALLGGVALLVLASRPGLIRVINRWRLDHAGGTKLVLALVVLALGFGILLTV
jgi:O-antigen/teichoic acid export membrane protein